MKRKPEHHEHHEHHEHPKHHEHHCRNTSAFDYHLMLRPDGSVDITDCHGKCIGEECTTEPPPIKQIVNTRTITIIEATGSRLVYVDPPGVWRKV